MNRIPYDVSQCLPLKGGIITGTISGPADETSCVTIRGAEHLADDDAYLQVYGKLNPTHPGKFILSARNSTQQYYLIGFPDGKLEWNGQYISNVAFPSTRTITLSFTNNGTITAPSDGWFEARCLNVPLGTGVALYGVLGAYSTAPTANGIAIVIVPVTKGTVLTMYGGNVTLFRFIYANGAY